ncbi:MAG: hypothetical protein H6679_03195 [Epsilonproteobacteria bacterium]|nr:hypothetical protein [Campylobacterota bacterium]
MQRIMQPLASTLFCLAVFVSCLHAQDTQGTMSNPQSLDLGKKPPLFIENGDYKLNFGGRACVEHYYQDNIYLLNGCMPDENEYFKHTVDTSLHFVYGEKKYGHKAVQAFTALRSKGIWGKPASFSDRESGPNSPSEVKISDSLVGSHSHTTGKPLIWAKEAWLQFSLNAAIGYHSPLVHTLKLGYFPFDLGRGIALGSAYGLNKEFLGLYSYPEDKAPPGILLHGEFFKDRFAYDIYYAKFEERSKGLSDTINTVNAHIVGRRETPWRGVNKDDELIAGRIKVKPVYDHDKIGTLELEPYVFYNAASDQKVEIAPDSKSQWGAFGIALEHKVKNFEWGGEVAVNYGHETLFPIDRNKSQIKRTRASNGEEFAYLTEEYSHILQKGLVTSDPNMTINAPVTQVSEEYALRSGLDCKGNIEVPTDGKFDDFSNKSDRFIKGYVNKFTGWMGVIDAAYTFEDIHLTVAGAYGYASGDKSPHSEEVNKRYGGFNGLHEVYSGKRVKSVIILGERFLKMPVTLVGGEREAIVDVTFSDIAYAGVSALWKPNTRVKGLKINPNLLFYWKTKTSAKFDAEKGEASTTEKARNFMGTEFNIMSSLQLSKDLTMACNTGLFAPAGYFTDIKGVPLDKNFFRRLVKTPANFGVLEANETLAKLYSLGNDTSYYLKVGVEYKF